MNVVATTLTNDSLAKRDLIRNTATSFCYACAAIMLFSGSGTMKLTIVAARSGVRFGSKADMCGATRDVRYVPIADIAPLHSITSSARASSDGGTMRPNILAVWALTTSSNLLACTTGKSAGMAPFRVRPV
jgi:hypothetical protein